MNIQKGILGIGLSLEPAIVGKIGDSHVVAGLRKYNVVKR